MTRAQTKTSLALAFGSFGLVALASNAAYAQPAPESDGYVVGDWTFKPSVDVRLRGEWRHRPTDTGGVSYGSDAVLATQPMVTKVPLGPVNNQYFLEERSRLGLGVEHGGTVSAQITLQDARLGGSDQGAYASGGDANLPSFEPLDAYIDVHTKTGRKVFFRIGRQRVTWGEGRLLGENDWSATARALDGARFGFQLGDFDFQLLGAILAVPGALPPSVAGTRQVADEATGSQLYGGDIVWHLFPLLKLEATGLGRMVRRPVPIDLTESDTYVADGRIFGDHRGFRYALEAAYELGRQQAQNANRTIGALALAGDASLETSLPWHLTFAVEGAYASGDDGDPRANDGTAGIKQKRFDPILPNEHAIDPSRDVENPLSRSSDPAVDAHAPTTLADAAASLSPMNAIAWSNVVSVGGGIHARPVDELSFFVGYRLLNLANANGQWTTGQLTPVGSSATNTSKSLGNEVDVAARLDVWRPVSFELGYGLFVFGDAAKQILVDNQRANDPNAMVAAGQTAPAASSNVQHWLYLQTTLRVP